FGSASLRTRTSDPGCSTMPNTALHPGGTSGSDQKYRKRASIGARLMQPWLRGSPNRSGQEAVCSARSFAENCVHGTVATEYGDSSPMPLFMSVSASLENTRHTPVSLGYLREPDEINVA